MNVGQRRAYEARKKKQKEFAVIFARVFTLMVKDNLVSKDKSFNVVDLSKQY